MHSFRLFDELLISGTNPCQLKQYLNAHKIVYEQKKIKESVHIRSSQKGFEIQYELQAKDSSSKQKHRVVSIFIYINNSKFKQYPQQNSLPFNLSHKMAIKAVVMLLGEPTAKSKVFTECIWKYLGIDIIFLSMNWTNQDAPIDYICLYDRDPIKICSVCKNNLNLSGKQYTKCIDCGLINYCSIKCRQQHYRLHKIYCQTIDEDESKKV